MRTLISQSYRRTTTTLVFQGISLLNLASQSLDWKYEYNFAAGPGEFPYSFSSEMGNITSKVFAVGNQFRIAAVRKNPTDIVHVYELPCSEHAVITELRRTYVDDTMGLTYQNLVDQMLRDADMDMTVVSFD
ncbi:hypothetical protein U1Q18_051026 [Sarracenia purpurea var. burkii]